MAEITLLTAVVAASGTGVAFAGDTTGGDGGVLSGNQVNVPVSVPISVCGNAVAVLGEALGVCTAEIPVSNAATGSESTSGGGSLLSGNQVSVPVSVPVDVCGNAISVLGRARAHCPGGNSDAGSAQIGHYGHGSNTGHGDEASNGHEPSGDGNDAGQPADNDNTPGTAGHHGRTPDGTSHHRHPGRRTHQHTHQLQRGLGAPTQLSSRVVGDGLPTTGANLTGLLALAGVAIALGVGALTAAGRRPRSVFGRHGRVGR